MKVATEGITMVTANLITIPGTAEILTGTKTRAITILTEEMGTRATRTGTAIMEE